MDNAEKQLVKSLEVALETIQHQQFEIAGLKAALFALRESVESGKPPLAFDEALRRGIQDRKESGHSDYEILPLLKEHLDKVRSLK